MTAGGFLLGSFPWITSRAGKGQRCLVLSRYSVKISSHTSYLSLGWSGREAVHIVAADCSCKPYSSLLPSIITLEAIYLSQILCSLNMKPQFEGLLCLCRPLITLSLVSIPSFAPGPTKFEDNFPSYMP